MSRSYVALQQHYSAQWFSVQGPICYVKPWQWLFAKWSSVLYEKSVRGATRSHFRHAAERIDMQMAGDSYAIFTSLVQSVVKLVVVVATAPVLVSSWAVVLGCYGAMLIVGVTLYFVNSPGTVRTPRESVEPAVMLRVYRRATPHAAPRSHGRCFGPLWRSDTRRSVNASGPRTRAS